MKQGGGSSPSALTQNSSLLRGIEAGGRFVEVNHDILLLGVVLQDDLVGLPSDTGLLIAAEGRAPRESYYRC